jgi:hypothetical protein
VPGAHDGDVGSTMIAPLEPPLEPPLDPPLDPPDDEPEGVPDDPPDDELVVSGALFWTVHATMKVETARNETRVRIMTRG